MTGVRQPVVVVVSDAPAFTVSDAVPDYLRFLASQGRRFRQIGVPRGSLLRRLLRFAGLLPLLWRAEIVVCEEYVNTSLVALLMRCSFAPGRVVALGLNVSGSRLLRTSHPGVNRLINRLVFGRLDLVVVASRPEAGIFSTMHGIPRERIAFIHWSYDLPRLATTIEPPARPYFCLIGRNNRDHETFCTALDGLEADGVIVAGTAPDLSLPPNVSAYADLPFGDCIELIRRSVANCVLVRDADRGAGHITLVTAMHCGRPQIVSDVATATDYFVPGRHALTVPLADPSAVRAAMRMLLDDRGAAEAMGVAAAAHAARWLTHERRRSELEKRLRRWLETGVVAWADSEWLASHEEALAASACSISPP